MVSIGGRATVQRNTLQHQYSAKAAGTQQSYCTWFFLCGFKCISTCTASFLASHHPVLPCSSLIQSFDNVPSACQRPSPFVTGSATAATETSSVNKSAANNCWVGYLDGEGVFHRVSATGTAVNVKSVSTKDPQNRMSIPANVPPICTGPAYIPVKDGLVSAVEDARNCQQAAPLQQVQAMFAPMLRSSHTFKCSTHARVSNHEHMQQAVQEAEQAADQSWREQAAFRLAWQFASLKHRWSEDACEESALQQHEQELRQRLQNTSLISFVIGPSNSASKLQRSDSITTAQNSEQLDADDWQLFADEPDIYL